VTPEEYQRVCDDLARKAIRYAAAMVAIDEELTDDLDGQCAHWIDVFLDEYLPYIDADVLFEVTRNKDVFEKNVSCCAMPNCGTPSRDVAAFHAFQADVWDAINRMEETAGPGEEETIARGMLSYSSAKVAMEMAHWHAMDHAEGSAGRARWQRVREAIARLKETP